MLGRETCSHAVVAQVASWTAVVMSMESVQLFGFISVLSMLRAMATAAGFREAARRNGTPPRRWMDSLLSCFVMRHGNNSVAPCWWLCICGICGGEKGDFRQISDRAAHDRDSNGTVAGSQRPS